MAEMWPLFIIMAMLFVFGGLMVFFPVMTWRWRHALALKNPEDVEPSDLAILGHFTFLGDDEGYDYDVQTDFDAAWVECSSGPLRCKSSLWLNPYTRRATPSSNSPLTTGRPPINRSPHYLRLG